MTARKEDIVLVVILLIVALVAFCTGGAVGAIYGRAVGRIDIASGRVIGERVINADGLTEWKWKEAGK